MIKKLTINLHAVGTPQRGLTLLELLVSIMIMGIMIAVAVPVIRPPVDARSVKEAARMVSTALASARTKSIETGRSWGVEFTPLSSGDFRQVGTLHFVRSITQAGSNGDVDGSGDFSASGLDMTEGGTLQLEMVGEKYEVSGENLNSGEKFPIPTRPPDRSDYKYRFEHRPRKSSLMPIQLPSRAVVDLGHSGHGTDLNITGITFSKTGEVKHVYTATGRADATERIHFFIGKTGRTGTTSDPEDNHLVDGEAIWVSVDPRTGAIKSTENYPVNDGSVVTARTWADQ